MLFLCQSMKLNDKQGPNTNFLNFSQMKKTLLFLAIIMLSINAFAEEEVYIPQKGDFSTEIQFNPFSGEQIFDNGGVFQGRIFTSDKSALLFELGLNGINTKEVDEALKENYNKDVFTRSYLGQFKIGLGYQYHFYNYKRISLYAGFKAHYIYQFAGKKTHYGSESWSWNNKGTGNGFGAYINTGIDFYIYKGLFLGAEIKAGFEDVLLSGYKVKTSNRKTTEYKQGGHIFEGGFKASPMIRLGWKF